MTAKSRKSITPWVTCEKCSSTISQKDMGSHESECPPSEIEWIHNYIRNGILYSSVDIYLPKELPKHLTATTMTDYIFMSESAMELCDIAMGSYVLIKLQNHIIVKEAFVSSEKSLTTVSLPPKTMQIYGVNNRARIEVQRFRNETLHPKEIIVQYIGKQMPPNLRAQIDSRKHLAIDEVFRIGNRVTFPFYGQNVKLKIIEIIGDNDERESIVEKDKDIEEEFKKLNIIEKTPKFYNPDYLTKWTFVSDETELKNKSTTITIDDIAGYEELLNRLRSEIEYVFVDKYQSFLKKVKMSKIFLIYGTTGVGKTAIANAVLSEYVIKIFTLKPGDICYRPHAEGEKILCDIFNEAKSQAPSAILFENIDGLCSRKSASDNERRLISVLLDEIDKLYNSDIKCLILATSAKPQEIYSELRCVGRIENEFEICAPAPHMRRLIIQKILTKLPNTINSDELEDISYTTHGFVAADLQRLCMQAAKCAIDRWKQNDDTNRIEIIDADFKRALTIITPATMKEVLVEVPDVKWTEIGGQETLKLKLKQAVEWPLKCPEAFTKLGIRPPRGVLMFGPPGCSKTMIARALATESKLNFINIKGPELFSKYVGDSEKAVREVFRKARQVAPSIVFIDEIDAIGGERTSGNTASGGNSVQERVLTQLLMELDGVTALGAVTLVAATNRPDKIDKALLRPGRLDRIIYVPLPDAVTRKEIFQIQFRKMPIDNDVNILDLVKATEGYSGAEVQAVCHEAAMKALEESYAAGTLENNITPEKITKMHFTSALELVLPRTPASLIQLYEDYKHNK